MRESQYNIFHMQKRTYPSRLGPILKGMSKELGLENGLAFHRLKKDWPDLVGHTIASHSIPEKIRFSTLTLRVDGAAWMHELSFLKNELLRRINRKLGKRQEKGMIQNLHLKLGALPKKQNQKAMASSSLKASLSGEEAALIRDRIASISDQGLKQAIEKAMKNHILKKSSALSKQAL